MGVSWSQDANVLSSESASMMEALRKEGGKVRFTLCSDLDHDCWAEVYGSSSLFEWFLKRHRLKPHPRSPPRTRGRSWVGSDRRITENYPPFNPHLWMSVEVPSTLSQEETFV